MTGNPRRTLVLTGGGARGAAQVGMLKAIHEAGVRFDAVIGCSVGALCAVRYAAAQDSEDLERLAGVWRGLQGQDLFPMSAYGVLRGVGGRSHLANPRPLRQLLERETPVGDLSEVKIPLGVVTTRLDTGLPVLWQAGEAVEILTASCAVPGIVPPVRLSDSGLHVDGGIASAAPVLLGQQHFPADEIWLLDVLGTEDPARHHRTLREIYQASFAHAMQSQVHNELLALRGPRLVHVKLDTRWTSIDSTDFSRTVDMLAAGQAAAEAILGRTR